MKKDFVIEFIGGGSIGDIAEKLTIDSSAYESRNVATGRNRQLVHRAFGAAVIDDGSPIDHPTLAKVVKLIKDEQQSGSLGMIQLFGDSLGCHYTLRLAQLLGGTPIAAITIADLPILPFGFKGMDAQIGELIPTNEPDYFPAGTPEVDAPAGISVTTPNGLTNYYQIAGNRWAPTRSAPKAGAFRWWNSFMIGKSPHFLTGAHSDEVHGKLNGGGWTNIELSVPPEFDTNDDRRHDGCCAGAILLASTDFSRRLLTVF